MKEELREQIERLHDDPMFQELLDIKIGTEVTESYLAEVYILQENPFATIEPEN